MSILTLQKANFWKRISAYLFDIILTVTLAIGFASLLSAVVGYDKHQEQLQNYYEYYEQTYGVDFDISEEDYNKLTEDEKLKYETAADALEKDENVLATYSVIVSLSLVILSFSVLLGILSIYFIVPLFFKNGQTLGKKIFGLAVVRSNLVKVSTPVLFARTLFGMYAIETMFPLFLLAMLYFNLMGGVALITIGLLLILQVAVLIVSKNNSSIHDLLSDTVVVEFASQRIFETQEALQEFIKEQQAIEAQNAAY